MPLWRHTSRSHGNRRITEEAVGSGFDNLIFHCPPRRGHVCIFQCPALQVHQVTLPVQTDIGSVFTDIELEFLVCLHFEPFIGLECLPFF